MSDKSVEQEAIKHARESYPVENGKSGLRQQAYFSFLAAAVPREKELVKLREREILWREYVDLLAAENNSLVGLAVVHGWTGNQANFEKGVRLRSALGIEPFKVRMASSE